MRVLPEIKDFQKFEKGAKIKYTFDINGTKYYFKTAISRESQEEDRSFLFSEALIAQVAKKAGIPCISPEVCKVQIDGKLLYGTLTPSFLNNGEFQRSMADILEDTRKYFDAEDKAFFNRMLLSGSSAEQGVRLIGLFCQENNKPQTQEHLKEIRNHLAEIAVVDFLVGNVDRHMSNVEFLFDKTGNTRVAPLYDNEYAFFGDEQKYHLMRKDIDATQNERAENLADWISNLGDDQWDSTMKQTFEKLLETDIKAELMECASQICGEPLTTIDSAVSQLKDQGIDLEENNYLDYVDEIFGSNKALVEKQMSLNERMPQKV